LDGIVHGCNPSRAREQAVPSIAQSLANIARPAHLARPRFPWAGSGKRFTEVPQQDHSWGVPRRTGVLEPKAAGTRHRSPSAGCGNSARSVLGSLAATAAKPRLRPKSYTDYESLLRLHIRPTLGARPLGAITQFDIQCVYAGMLERGLSARTVEYTNAVPQSAFRQAVRWRMLAEDPCLGVDLPRQKRTEMQALSVEECRGLLDAARQTEYFALIAGAALDGFVLGGPLRRTSSIDRNATRQRRNPRDPRLEIR